MAQHDGSSKSKASGGLGSFLLGKLQDVVHDIGSGIDQTLGVNVHQTNQNRYGSFAAQTSGNDAKWYVDGCGYMWAVSRALEQASESIWILDCGPPQCSIQLSD